MRLRHTRRKWLRYLCKAWFAVGTCAFICGGLFVGDELLGVGAVENRLGATGLVASSPGDAFAASPEPRNYDLSKLGLILLGSGGLSVVGVRLLESHVRQDRFQSQAKRSRRRRRSLRVADLPPSEAAADTREFSQAVRDQSMNPRG